MTYLSDTVNVNEIREEQQYGGLRVTLTAMLGSAKIHSIITRNREFFIY